MNSKMLAQWDFSVPDLPVDNWWFCTVVLIVLMLVIWMIAHFITSATEEIDPAETDRQMLTAFTELKSRGDLSTEEYRSIKSQLVTRLSDQDKRGDGRVSQETQTPSPDLTAEVDDQVTDCSSDADELSRPTKGDVPVDEDDEDGDKDLNDE